jgi:hypothetical protein
MQYINKTENAREGYQVVDTLLEDAWNDDEQRYIGFNYAGLGNKGYENDGIEIKYTDKIMQLCLQEQGGFCCYCMKKINADEANIEHIIPQNPPESDFDRYMRLAEFVDNIIHKNGFDTQIKVERLDRYPHDIAYHNLIASCRSKIRCNSKRGNSYIEPIIYYRNIQDRIWYEKNGSIGSDEFYDLLTDILGLNDDELKSIRQLWQLFAKKYETLLNMEDVSIEDLIYEVISTNDDDNRLIERFGGKGNQLTKKFRQFEWFFTYYGRY